MNNSILQPLVELGFTNLEAEIYTFLLQYSPSTGYGIAKGIGKPAANTYKAIESLQNKGAIIIEDSRTRLCRAISGEELLDAFQRRFDSLKLGAAEEFKKIKSAPNDNRIYQLQTIEQLLARYRQMFAACQRAVMLDFFPFPATALREDIIAAAKRGVKITMRLYKPCPLPGVETIIDPDSSWILRRWPGQWANGVFDGEEYILAFLSLDASRIIQAVWSNNHYLSWVYYQGLVHEHLATILEQGINENWENKKLKKVLNKYSQLLKLESTGYKYASTFFRETGKSGAKRSSK